MSVIIRLSRQGTKKKPHYAIVAATKTAPRDGKYLENLGSYDPRVKNASEALKVKRESVDAWVQRGAQLSETVGQLLKSAPKLTK